MQKAGQGFTSSDGKVSVPTSIREAVQGTSADVAAFWTGSSLDDALARPRSESVNLQPAGLTVRDGDIVYLSELKRMSDSEASARRRGAGEAVGRSLFPRGWPFVLSEG